LIEALKCASLSIFKDAARGKILQHSEGEIWAAFVADENTNTIGGGEKFIGGFIWPLLFKVLIIPSY
jgi:hypothetical protein